MATVFIPREKPTGKALDYFDLIPSTGFHYKQAGNKKPINMQKFEPPSLSQNAFHRPNNMIVYSAKEVNTKRIIGKSQPLADGLGQKPITLSRGRYDGLDNTGMYRRTGAIMPIASSFNSSLNNRLGQPA